MERQDNERVQALQFPGEGGQVKEEPARGAIQEASFVAEVDTSRAGRCRALGGWADGRRFAALTVLALLLVLTVPTRAFAVDYWGTVDGPFVTGQVENDKGYVVLNVRNKLDAALALIGRASDKIQLSNDQMAKLSNASTGGAFNALANTFSAVGADGTTNHYIGWWGDTLYQANMVSITGGYGTVWATETNQSKIASALEDYMVVYNGGSLGGGASQGTTPQHDEANHVWCKATKVQNQIWSNKTMKYFNSLSDVPNGARTSLNSNTFYDNLPANPWLCIWDVSYNKMIEYSRDYDVIYAGSNWTNSQSIGGQYYILERGKYTLDFADGRATLKVLAGGRYMSQSATTWVYKDLDGNIALEFGVNWESDTWSTASRDTELYVAVAIAKFSNLHNETIGEPVEPVTPPNNWPETEPNTPNTPEVHEPTVVPDYPEQVTYDEPTYVEADLSAILDALNEHCLHLQDAIYTGLNNLYSSLAGYMTSEMYLLRSEMYDEFSWIYDGLESHDVHMQFNFERVLMALRNLDTSSDVDLQPVIDAINGLDLPADPVATDLTALEHQLVDLTESDYQVLTVRGLLHWINYYSQDIDRKLDAIEDYEDGEGNLYVRGYLRELLTDFDNLMLVLEEWPDYPSLSTVETRLQDIWDSLDDFADNFVSYWHEVRQKMDDILRAIEGLPQDSEPLHWPDSPLVPPLETPDGGGDIIGPLETDPNGYPVMPDWTFWTERPEMDALDEAIDELMTKFPFCTLNDLVTIFTRLVRPAQAPQFDVPVPNPSDWSAPYMLHVDLSELDPVAAVMRMGITLWVTVRLARRSIRMWTHDEYVEGDGA